MKNIRKIIAVVMMLILSVFLFACESVNKNEEASAKIAEKYFDALKYGDYDDEMECYTPIVRKKEEAQYGLLGQASRLLFRVDLSELIKDFNTLFGENSFEEYDYKVEQVVLDEEEKKGKVYVAASKDGEYVESIRVDTVKYDGEWYIEYQSMAPDDRSPEEKANAETSEEVSNWWENKVLWIVVGCIVAIILACFVVVLIKNNSHTSSRSEYDYPPVYPTSGGGYCPGDIMCSCGTLNTAGFKTCIGCGKKLKKRR